MRTHDSTPLPAGWSEHYDTERQTWYYVNTNVVPAQVLFTHPLSLEPPPSVGHTIERGDSIAIPPVPRSTSGNSPRAGLSKAQQLYASAVTKKAPFSCVEPVGCGTQPPTIKTVSYDPSGLPTPPPSVSPAHSTFPAYSLAIIRDPLPSTPSSCTPAHGAPVDAISLYHSSIAARRIGTQSRGGHVPPTYTSPSSIHGSSYDHHHRSSMRPASPPRQQSHRHRSSTYSSGMPARQTFAAPSVGAKTTPSFTTIARPPRSHTTSFHSSIDFWKDPDTTPPPAQFQYNHSQSIAQVPPAVVARPPQDNAPATADPFPLPGSTPHMQVLHQGTSTNPPLVPPPPSAKVRGRQARNTLLQMGKVMGTLALKVADGVVLPSTGLPPGLAGAAGTVGGLNGDVVGALASAFSGMSTEGAGIDTSQLEAVLQGQPTADYQEIINILVQQQPVAQMGQLVDYQTLISELQRVQATANAQQQTIAQAQVANTQAVHNAQIQQMQTILNSIQTLPAVPTATANQNVPNVQVQGNPGLQQSQQNKQNLLQAAHQQQQQMTVNAMHAIYQQHPQQHQQGNPGPIHPEHRQGPPAHMVHLQNPAGPRQTGQSVPPESQAQLGGHGMFQGYQPAENSGNPSPYAQNTQNSGPPQGVVPETGLQGPPFNPQVQYGSLALSSPVPAAAQEQPRPTGPTAMLFDGVSRMIQNGCLMDGQQDVPAQSSQGVLYSAAPGYYYVASSPPNGPAEQEPSGFAGLISGVGQTLNQAVENTNGGGGSADPAPYYVGPASAAEATGYTFNSDAEVPFESV